jgi:hypothetical protein
MTKAEAWEDFQENILPQIRAREGTRGVDLPMRSEAWNNYTDALCKDGQITMRQYETWTHPRFLGIGP